MFGGESPSSSQNSLTVCEWSAAASIGVSGVWKDCNQGKPNSTAQQHALWEAQQCHPCVTVDKDKERRVFPRAIVKWEELEGEAEARVNTLQNTVDL
jgi:hypothetical protein